MSQPAHADTTPLSSEDLPREMLAMLYKHNIRDAERFLEIAATDSSILAYFLGVSESRLSDLVFRVRQRRPDLQGSLPSDRPKREHGSTGAALVDEATYERLLKERLDRMWSR